MVHNGSIFEIKIQNITREEETQIRKLFANRLISLDKRKTTVIKQNEQDVDNQNSINYKKLLLDYQMLQKKHENLLHTFALLKEKYDEQKSSLLKVLWEHCSSKHPDLMEIPTDDNTLVETDHQVGSFFVHDFIAEGTFSVVKMCNRINDSTDLAIKIIEKEKITTFVGLKRLSDEIENLKILKNVPFVISIITVYHTAKNLYIVTEKGGSDLFEFMQEYQDIPETWSRLIIRSLLNAVSFCHSQGICHRDLKPENVLLEFNASNPETLKVKLCDFGLSAKFQKDVILSDFCGSLGFFAHEMLTEGRYYGDKVDIWSIGCILLEMMLGHNKFVNCWMIAYELVHDIHKFKHAIYDSIINLEKNRVLDFSVELNDFILQFIKFNCNQRWSIRKLLKHSFLIPEGTQVRFANEPSADGPLGRLPDIHAARCLGLDMALPHAPVVSEQPCSSPGADSPSKQDRDRDFNKLPLTPSNKLSASQSVDQDFSSSALISASLPSSKELPVVNQNPAQIPTNLSPRSVLGTKGLRILLVEDDSLQRKLMSKKLCVAGQQHTSTAWQVDDQIDGEKALTALLGEDRSGGYDVIIVDETLSTDSSKLKGHQVIKILREDPKFKNVVIIGCSADLSCNNDFIKAGADAVWEKPFPSGLALTTLISEMMHRRRRKQISSDFLFEQSMNVLEK